MQHKVVVIYSDPKLHRNFLPFEYVLKTIYYLFKQEVSKEVQILFRCLLILISYKKDQLKKYIFSHII